MAIALLLICFLGLILLFISVDNTRLSVLKSVLIYSVLVLGVTEILSVFYSLNYFSLVIVWGIIDTSILYVIYKKEAYKKIYALRVKLKETIKNLSRVEQFFVGFSTFILAGVFVQGIVYPTANWDSMAYHMARIVHWIQNESLAHYRTSIYPQLNSAPFAEELILNVNLLFGNDYLSNSVQWFYLLSAFFSISLIAKELGLNRFGQLFSAFILVCIPEVILLGSSTHNEIVLSFFMLMCIYYFLKISSEKTVVNFVLLGFSLGLAAATKHTAYLYLAPFVTVFFGYIVYFIVLKKEWFLLSYCSLLVRCFALVNTGQYSRNYQLSSTILGATEEINGSYVNQEHSLKMMVSNVSRNISYQFGIPMVTPIVYNLTDQLHDAIGEDIHNPKTTFNSFELDPLAIHENNGANIYHMLLMLLSMVWMLIYAKKHNIKLTLFWVVCVCSFLTFCFYLKLVPYVKLHVPFFMFYSVIIAYFLTKFLKSKLVLNLSILGFVIYACLILVFNVSRPFITLPPFTYDVTMSDDRYEKYFSNSFNFHHDYKKVKEIISVKKYKNIGLMLGSYSMEYQLFVDSYRSDIKSIHINSCLLSESLPIQNNVDCIVSTEYENQIKYEGTIYYNATKDNDGYLFLYLKK